MHAAGWSHRPMDPLPRDRILAFAVIAALVLMLAWVVTGEFLFAVVALLIAASYWVATIMRRERDDPLKERTDAKPDPDSE
jgi:hypothetical protein